MSSIVIILQQTTLLLSEILLSGHDGLDVEFAYSIGSKVITAYDYLFAPFYSWSAKTSHSAILFDSSFK